MNDLSVPQAPANDELIRENKLLEQVNQKGHDLFMDKHYLTAASMFKRCMLLRPQVGTYGTNYGSTLWHLGRFDEALEILAEQVKRWPGFNDARENYGKVLTSFERFEEAVEQFDAILERDPTLDRVRMQRAFTKLDSGDWAAGLVDYEARRTFKQYQSMPMPTWEGEDLSGKTLYVQSEQGAGDCILFSRYLWWIKQKWPTCTIKFCCHHELVKLLWNYQSRGILTFMPEGIPWSDNPADYGTFLASLPRLHGTTTSNIPLDPGLIEQRCGAQQFDLFKPELGKPLKIGVCWTGNPEMLENHRRSVPIEKFINLSGNSNYMFYSVQLGPGRDQLFETMGFESIADVSNYIKPHGFIATGAMMTKVDLMITVCTSVAHLAGAMGVPTWLLLCKEPYWVWGRKGTTTPWYPSIRLFRQPEHGDWDSVFEEVESELAKLYATIGNVSAAELAKL